MCLTCAYLKCDCCKKYTTCHDCLRWEFGNEWIYSDVFCKDKCADCTCKDIENGKPSMEYYSRAFKIGISQK